MSTHPTGSTGWILHNGFIGGADAWAEAIAISGGVVTARGRDAEILSTGLPGATATDLRGATVLPGFVDTHLHFEKVAHALSMVRFDTTETLDDALARVGEAAAGRPAGTWVEVFGNDPIWHETQWPERRLPTRGELDRATTRHPVLISRSPDAAVLNSSAIERLGEALAAVPARAWDPARGWVMGSSARALARRVPAAGTRQVVERLGAASRRLLALGITTVLDPGIAGGFDDSWVRYTDAWRSGAVKQRIAVMNRLDASQDPEEALNGIERGPAVPGTGDERLRAGGVKLLLDGEISDAWMRTGDPSGGQATRNYSEAQVASVTRRCLDRGWPLCVHVIGGGAMDAALAAFEQASRDHDVDVGQLSLAHAFFPSEENIARSRELGVVMAVQPALMWAYGAAMRRAWGQFADRAMPLRTLLDAGVGVAGGSDVVPCDPLLGAATAVSRRVLGDMRLGIDQGIGASDAIGLFTDRNSTYARAQGLAGVGNLEVGAHADFTVWSGWPGQHLPSSWSEPAPGLVAVAGRPVHGEVPR